MFQITQPTTTDAMSLLNNQIQIFGVVSSLFLGLVTVIFLILGYLVYSNNEQRKEAEKNMEAINSMYKKIAKIMNQSELMMKTIQRYLEDAEKGVKEIEDGLVQSKSVSDEAINVKAQLFRLKENIGKSLASVSAVHGTIPTFPNPSGSLSVSSARSALDDYLAGDKKNNWESIRRALNNELNEN